MNAITMTSPRRRVAGPAAGRQQGMTLIELLIVVVVIAILGAIAMTNYLDQTIRSRRAAGAACLQEAVQAVERFYTENLTYTGAPAQQCDPDVAQHYTIAIATPTAKTFTLTATPVAGSSQVKDTTCGALSIDQAGTEGETGSATNATECF